MLSLPMFRPLIFAVALGFFVDRLFVDPTDAVGGEAALGQPASLFFAEHCRKCHSGPEPQGDFVSDSLALDFTGQPMRKRWEDVLDQIRVGRMPPEGEPRPAPAEAAAMVKWIEDQIGGAEAARRAIVGRSPLRRLNQIEYQNTVRDLFQVDVDLTGVLPADSNGGGFDTDAESLHLSSYLLESYLNAANIVLDEAIASGPRPPLVEKRIEIKDDPGTKRHGVYRHLDDGVAIFASDLASNIQLVFWNFLTRHRGNYQFRISANAYQSDKPVIFHINGGTDNLGDPPYLIDYFEAPPGKPTVFEFTRSMEAGRNIRLLVDAPVRPRDLPSLGGAEKYEGPGLAVQWIEMKGPLIESWPPPSHRLIFGDLPLEPSADNPSRREVVSKEPRADAERILRGFARRAFRRPVSDEELRPTLSRVGSKLDDGYSFERAVRVGLREILLSPSFLFLRESGIKEDETPTVNASAVPRPLLLDDHALASRLSYLLWSSMPDAGLYRLAEEGRLGQPEVLRGEVERMLKDPKAAEFTENFAGQWLGLREIDSTLPDRQLYPEYDDLLRQAMIPEVNRFFEDVLRNDLSVTHFVLSDFGIINQRLAKHYGIPGVEGLEFRRVAFPSDSHRGGLLTMAAVLKVTANGTTTSPITRGAWVLDRILGTPPPRPPANISAVEPDIRGATTIRDQLAKHRKEPTCASCHLLMDPPGFALENFDVVGGWRERYRSIGDGEPVTVDGRRMRYKHGPAVESADRLFDGRAFGNIDEFKALLASDPDQLSRALASKLVAYATGTPTTLADRQGIESIVESVRDKNYGFRSLVHEVVQSELFRNQ
jgi:hypothetical protein